MSWLWAPRAPSSVGSSPQTVTLTEAVATGPTPEGAVNIGSTLGGLAFALTVAIGTATVPSMTVAQGGMTTTLTVATATATPLALSVVTGGQTVTLTVAASTAQSDSAPNLAVTFGGLTVPLTVATAKGNGNAESIVNLSATLGGSTTLTPAVAVATALGLTVSIGGQAVALSSATAAATAVDLASSAVSLIVPKPVTARLLYRWVDPSPDGKSVRMVAGSDRVTFGSPPTLTDRPSFTAIVLVKFRTIVLAKSIISKRNSGGGSNGWGLMLRTGGELWFRWARATTSVSYITTQVIAKVGEHAVLVVTADQAAAANGLVEIEYGRWGAPLRRATFSSIADGTGSFATDAGQELRLGAFTSNADAVNGDVVFAGLWPKLTLGERTRLAADLLTGRESALGWWRPGHRGQNRVEDESGHGLNGTIGGTGQARSSIRNLWYRPWMRELPAITAGLVTLGTAQAVATVPDLGTAETQVVALEPAIATATAPDFEGAAPWWMLQTWAHGMVTPHALSPWLNARPKQYPPSGIETWGPQVGFQLLLGPQTAVMVPAIATGVTGGLAFPGGLAVPLGAAIGAATADPLTTVASGITVTLGPAIATAVSLNAVGTAGGLTVGLVPAVATGTALNGTVPGGALVVALSPAIAQATALTGNAAEGGATTLVSAAAAAVAADLNAVAGGQTVALSPAIATTAAFDLSGVAFGGQTVTLTEAIATTVATPLGQTAGEFFPLGDAVSLAVATDLVVAVPGPLVVALEPAIATATPVPLFVIGGGTAGILAPPLVVEGTIFPLLHVRGSILRLT